METPKRIALVTCASNFERHGNIIRAMHRRISDIGGYALYVLTNYGAYEDGMDFSHGEPAIYHLLDEMELDGCILEANLGSNELTERIVHTMRRRSIPVLTINLEVEDVPYLHLETGNAGSELIDHLIHAHQCSRLNLVLNSGNSVVSASILKSYQTVLARNGIPYDERRIYTCPVSLQQGRDLYDCFERRGVMKDAQAVLCVHDVCAIGLTLELQSRGIRVPEDIRICSMNSSGNSIAFRPDITGLDRMDRTAAELACELMDQMIRGETIPQENTYSGEVRYRASCGCTTPSSASIEHREFYQRLILNKVEAGNQIGRMMQLNDSLEDVDSLSQFASNIDRMMRGLQCASYFCCLNSTDLPFIENRCGDSKTRQSPPYDEEMTILSGYSDRTGPLTDITFPLKEVIPVAPRDGDLFLFLPIHHISRDYGYMVILNNHLAVDNFNYRICQESIGSNIENLHRQMILKSSIEELDRLHMQDPLTGLCNRFALHRFSEDYTSSPEGYCVAMLDLDGLKKINDNFGHPAGNNAICLSADTIRETMEEGDLIIRYGGDEFLILSHCLDSGIWDKHTESLNRKLTAIVQRHRLPYTLGISLGYAISDSRQPLSFDDALSLADRSMYENKKARKAMRED